MGLVRGHGPSVRGAVSARGPASCGRNVPPLGSTPCPMPPLTRRPTRRPRAAASTTPPHAGSPRTTLPHPPARFHRRPGGARRVRDVLHDGLHRRPEPAHPRLRQGRRRPATSAAAPPPTSRRSRPARPSWPAIMTILMGVFANYPLALATGLGLNAFVAFSIASQMTWADAMGVIVLEGLVILVLVLTGFRTAVFHAVPSQLKVAISVGIGLFIALIGLVDAGFVRRTGVGPVPVELGVGGQLTGWPTVVFVLGLGLLITLWVRKVKGAIIISILTMTVVAFVVEAIAQVGSHRHRGRRGRQQHRQPERLEPERAGLAVDDRPDQLRHARRVQPARVLPAGRHRRDHPARLHADARRLLRHHGHDDGDRRRGRPARRGRHAAQRPAHPRRRLARRGRRWRGRCLVEHLLHRVGVGCRRGRAHRPGLGRDRRCCSSCRSW